MPKVLWYVFMLSFWIFHSILRLLLMVLSFFISFLPLVFAQLYILHSNHIHSICWVFVVFLAFIIQSIQLSTLLAGSPYSLACPFVRLYRFLNFLWLSQCLCLFPFFFSKNSSLVGYSSRGVLSWIYFHAYWGGDDIGFLFSPLSNYITFTKLFFHFERVYWWMKWKIKSLAIIL